MHSREDGLTLEYIDVRTDLKDVAAALGTLILMGGVAATSSG